MAKIDKYNYLLDKVKTYDYKEKDRNITNYVGYSLDRSLIMFKYHGLPETIPEQELEQLLQMNGFACITKVGEDLYAFNGGLGGVQDVYGNPTQIVIANPALNYNATLEIDTDCVIMQNDTLMMGLLPLYYRYSSILVENDITMVLASINKRMQNLIAASDDSSYESAKEFVKKIAEGELSVIADSKLFDGIKNVASSNASKVTMQELIEFEQYLKASLYNEIGLNANFNMKRERLTAGEVEANTDNLYPLVDNMIECRRAALEKINTMYGTSIEVEFNSSWDYRVFQGESIHNTQTEVDGSELTEDEEMELDAPDTETQAGEGEETSVDDAGEEQEQEEQSGSGADEDEQPEETSVDDAAEDEEQDEHKEEPEQPEDTEPEQPESEEEPDEDEKDD